MHTSDAHILITGQVLRVARRQRCNLRASSYRGSCSVALGPTIGTHTVLDLVVDDEIHFTISEAKIVAKGAIDFVNHGLASFRDNALHGEGVMLERHLAVFRMVLKIPHQTLRLAAQYIGDR